MKRVHTMFLALATALLHRRFTMKNTLYQMVQTCCESLLDTAENLAVSLNSQFTQQQRKSWIMKIGSRKRTHRLSFIGLGLIALGLVALLPVTASFGQTCVPPPPGTFSWWPGEANTNDIIQANHGTLMNGATYATGMVGQAFSFDGVNDFVEVADHASLDITTEITIVAWINPDSLHTAFGGSTARIVDKITAGKADGYLLDIHLGKLRLICTSSGKFFFSTTSPSLNTWTHVAATYNGTGAKLYINGVLNGNYAIAGGSIPTNNLSLRIGNGHPGTVLPFPGKIDEVKLYNRALTSAEIQAIYNAGSAGVCKPGVPPTLTCSENIVANNDPGTGGAVVNYTVTATGDPSPSVTCTPASGSVFPIGTTTVNCTATNANGSVSCSFTVTVVDNEPPSTTCSVNPASLWPPNHKMKDISASFTASDNSGSATVVLTSITSNEPDNGLGDGDTPDDIQNASYGTADTQFKLRAERSGRGNGRIYTITYSATDASGNSSTCVSTVTVPHSPGSLSDINLKEISKAPEYFALHGNYPNPFNPSTVIRYSLPVNGVVTLKVFNTLGEEVSTLLSNEEVASGEYEATFTAESLPSGIYFYRINVESVDEDGMKQTFTDTKKLMLLR